MEKTIGIIGFGSMGSMIARKILESGALSARDLRVSNRTPGALVDFAAANPGVAVCASNAEAARGADIVFVCVKPVDMKSVFQEIGGDLVSDAHIITINASVMFTQIESVCPGARITKCIPSVTGEVGESVTLVCHNMFVTEEQKIAITKILSAIGTIEELEEGELGIVSEVTSCMPGFISAIFRVIAREAAHHTSLDSESIRRMLMQTLHGTSALFLEQDLSFDAMIARVATKGGITEEGTKVIDAQFPQTIAELFEKTAEKRALVRMRAIDQFNG